MIVDASEFIDQKTKEFVEFMVSQKDWKSEFTNEQWMSHYKAETIHHAPGLHEVTTHSDVLIFFDVKARDSASLKCDFNTFGSKVGTEWIYGVCDTPEQAQKHCAEQMKRVIGEEPPYLVMLTKVRRDLDNKGKGGGWRWHKWGVYIGDKEPSREYLDDEPEIEEVFVFKVIEIAPEHVFDGKLRPVERPAAVPAGEGARRPGV